MNEEIKKKIKNLKSKNKLECFLLQSAYIEAIITKYFRFILHLELNDKPLFIKAVNDYVSNVNGILRFSKLAELFESEDLIREIDRYNQKRNEIVHNILEPIKDFEAIISKEIETGDEILEKLSFVEKVISKAKTTEDSGFIASKSTQSLDDLEKEVFIKYHINSRNLRDIAKEYGVTHQYIQQILKNAEHKMSGVVLNYKTSNLLKVSKKKLTPNIIIESVCEALNVSKKEVLSKSRKAYLVLPRHIIMFLLKERLEMSYPKIVKSMNRTDHTTAIHAYQKVESLIKKGKISIID